LYRVEVGESVGATAAVGDVAAEALHVGESEFTEVAVFTVVKVEVEAPLVVATGVLSGVEVKAKQEVFPGKLVKPKPQGVQEDCAVFAWYVPAGHGVGAPEPATQ